MSDASNGTNTPTTEAPLMSGQFNTGDGFDAMMKPNEAESGPQITIDEPGAEAQKTPEQIAAEAAEAEATKAKTTEEIKAKIEADKFAAKFAALSRKEKQLRERERQMQAHIKQLEEAAKAKEAELSSKLIDPTRLKREPLKVLEETGLTFQQLAELVLNDGKPTPDMLISEKERELKAEIESIKKQIEAKEQAEAEARLQAQIDNFKGKIQSEIANNTTDYELINANGAFDLVYEVIEAHHARTAAESDDGQGEILSIKAAADAVEQHLLEEAKKVLGLSKIKGMLQPEASKQPVATAAQSSSQAAATQPATKTAAKTLSNAVAATAQNPKRRLSDDESKAEAAKLLKWID